MDFNAWEEEWSRRAARKAEKAIQATAYHEAGHVVVTLHEKEQVESVSIAGRMTHTNPLRGIDVEWDDSPQIRSRTESLIRICLAGPIAQKRFNPHGFRKHHAEHDWEEATNLVLYLGGDEETTNACLQQLENQTHDIIDRHWKHVGAVAEALLEQKKLSGAQVKEIIERTEEELATP